MLLFASAREAAGRRRDELDVGGAGGTDGALTVGDALAVLVDRYGPAFGEVLGAARVWVNGDEPSDGPGTRLVDGDELAVLPPVSGGSVAGGAAPVTRPVGDRTHGPG